MSAPTTGSNSVEPRGTILLGVTGGIAAYKAAELVSRLKKDGFAVIVIMTQNATEFITPLTLEVLANHPVAVDQFDRGKPWEVEHVSWAKAANLFVVAPATANFIGKYAHGIADDMLTTTAMATRAPVLLAPAMNTAMYESAATQENLQILARRGVEFVGPEGGLLACGDIGLGRMSEPEAIARRIGEMFDRKTDLEGKRILITAGPTREALDPVRYITNRSSGKMGVALARAAMNRGAQVTLVAGELKVDVPAGVAHIPVESTQDMYDAAVAAFPACDWAILSAAPADYTPVAVEAQKMKKTGGPRAIDLRETPDIAAALGHMKREGQRSVIFAAETQNALENGAQKRLRKNADLVVVNDVTQAGAGFDGDTNIITIIGEAGVKPHDIMPKAKAADVILDAIVELSV